VRSTNKLYTKEGHTFFNVTGCQGEGMFGFGDDGKALGWLSFRDQTQGFVNLGKVKLLLLLSGFQ
jgi:hypothetical protein